MAKVIDFRVRQNDNKHIHRQIDCESHKVGVGLRQGTQYTMYDEFILVGQSPTEDAVVICCDTKMAMDAIKDIAAKLIEQLDTVPIEERQYILDRMEVLGDELKSSRYKHERW